MLKVSAAAFNTLTHVTRHPKMEQAIADFSRREVGRQRLAARIAFSSLPDGHPDLRLRGYTNPDAVAERIVRTVVHQVGESESALAAAQEAVRRGFTMAERMLSGLPPVAVETRKLVEEKFEKLFRQNF